MRSQTKHGLEPSPGILILGLSILALSLGAAASMDAGTRVMYSGGPWIDSNYSQQCPTGSLCAEWPNTSQTEGAICCISPSAVGTYDTEACEVFFGVRPLGPPQ